jgi:hypothetical protein
MMAWCALAGSNQDVERHLKRLLSSYLLYYDEDRSHLGLAKDTPVCRAKEIRSAGESKIQSFPRLGGLHHRCAGGNVDSRAILAKTKLFFP